MLSTRAQTALTTFILFITSSLTGQNRVTLEFSSESDSVQHPVQLPPEAMALLVKDQQDFPEGPPADFHCTGKEIYPSGGEDPIPQILCTKLPLSTVPGKDYLVIGVGALRGAHIIPFWIIHQDSDGATLLFKDRSDGFSVLLTRYHGYRELEVIRVFQAGATVQTDRFRFNGKRYVRFSSRETHH